jgi:hypothetical protein
MEKVFFPCKMILNKINHVSWGDSWWLKHIFMKYWNKFRTDHENISLKSNIDVHTVSPCDFEYFQDSPHPVTQRSQSRGLIGLKAKTVYFPSTSWIQVCLKSWPNMYRLWWNKKCFDILFNFLPRAKTDIIFTNP